MKKSWLIILLICCVSVSYSQEFTLKYLPISNYINLKNIEVSNLEDFKRIIRDNSIGEAYFYEPDSNGKYSIMLVNVGETYYSFQINGFKTLSEYEYGVSKHFPYGKDYYEAKRLGLADNDLLIYFKRNSFRNIEDCVNSFNGGFVKENGLDLYTKKVLPLEFEKNEIRALEKYVPDFSKIINYDGVTKKEYYELVNSKYKLKDIYKRIYEPETVRSNVMKEYEIYYWSILNDIKTFKNYDILVQAVKDGFINEIDKVDASIKGFKYGSSYYNAKKNGFDNSTDYETAQEAKILTYEEYRKYKKFFDSITSLNINNRTYAESVYLYLLSILRNPISIDGLIKYAEKNILISNQIKSLFERKKVVFDSSSIKKFLEKYSDSDYGHWDKENEVFFPK